MSDELVSVSREALRTLYSVFDAWWNEVECHESDRPGHAEMLTSDGSLLLEDVCCQFEPHDDVVRRLLGLKSDERAYERTLLRYTPPGPGAGQLKEDA